jgi:nitroreductase
MRVNVTDAIQTRRAYRSLEPFEVTDELIRDLARHAGLAPSCNNNQPWRFVFVRDPAQLAKVHAALPKNNKWIELASMIVAVFSRAGEDCTVKDRIYHQFDTGMGTAFLILRATELGLVAHPVAGYDEAAVKQALSISEEYQLITLVNVGRHSASIHPYLTEKQAAIEAERPTRKSFEGYAYVGKYTPPTPSPI